MKAFLLGAAAGYVLGAKAGHERYEQILRTYRKLADHPAVQGAAGVARAKVGEKVGDVLPSARRTNQHARNGNGQQRSSAPRP